MVLAGVTISVKIKHVDKVVLKVLYYDAVTSLNH